MIVSHQHRFVFAAGDSSSVAGAQDTITDYVAGTDVIALGVVGTSGPSGNFQIADPTVTYAQALADATALITSGTRDIVAIQVTGGDTYVFADSAGDNTISNVIKLTGTVTLTNADFVA